MRDLMEMGESEQSLTNSPAESAESSQSLPSMVTPFPSMAPVLNHQATSSIRSPLAAHASMAPGFVNIDNSQTMSSLSETILLAPDHVMTLVVRLPAPGSHLDSARIVAVSTNLGVALGVAAASLLQQPPSALPSELLQFLQMALSYSAETKTSSGPLIFQQQPILAHLFCQQGLGLLQLEPQPNHALPLSWHWQEHWQRLASQRDLFRFLEGTLRWCRDWLGLPEIVLAQTDGKQNLMVLQHLGERSQVTRRSFLQSEIRLQLEYWKHGLSARWLVDAHQEGIPLLVSADTHVLSDCLQWCVPEESTTAVGVTANVAPANRSWLLADPRLAWPLCPIWARQNLRAQELRSSVALSLEYQGRLWGMLALYGPSSHWLAPGLRDMLPWFARWLSAEIAGRTHSGASAAFLQSGAVANPKANTGPMTRKIVEPVLPTPPAGLELSDESWNAPTPLTDSTVAADFPHAPEDSSWPPDSSATDRLEMFEAVSDLVFSVNAQGSLTYVNSGWRRAMGYSSKLLTQMRDRDFVHPQDWQHYALAFQQVKVVERSKPVRLRWQNANGDTLWVEGTLQRAHSVFNGSRQAVIRGMFRNVTEQHQAEEAHRRSQVYYRALVECLPLGIFLKDRQGRFTFVNPGYCQLLGKPETELLGRRESEVRPATSVLVGRHEEREQALWQSGDSMETIEAEPGNGGLSRIFRVLRTPLRDGSQQILAIQGVVWDITESRRSAEELAASREQLQFALESTQDGLFDWDLEQDVVHFAPRWSQILGYADEELARQIQTWLDLCHPLDSMTLQERLEEHLSGQTPAFELEYRMRHQAGHWLWVLGRAKVVKRDDSGKPLRLVGTILDIHSRKETEAQLKESHDLFQLVLSATNDGIWDWDLKTQQVIYSKRWWEMLAWNETDWPQTSETWRKLIHPQDLPRVEQLLSEHWSRGTPFVHSSRFRHRNGTWRWLMVRGLTLRDENSLPYRMIGNHTDITELVATTDSLRQSEQRFELAVNGSHDGIWDWNMVTGELYWSPRFKALLGYGKDEIRCDFPLYQSLIHANDRNNVMEKLQHHIKQRLPFDVEHRLLTKSGSYRWFRIRGQALWDQDRRATRMAGSLTDITDRKAVEHHLTESRQLLEEAQSIAKIGSWQLVLATQDMTWSPEMYRILQLDPKTTSPSLLAWQLQLHAEDRPLCQTTFSLARKNGKPFEAEWRLQLADGQMKVVQLRGRGKLGTDGQVALLSGTLQDITQQKQVEADLRRAKEAADAANRSKSEFLANMSHEIRTPMTSILGFAEILLDSCAMPEAKDAAATIVRNGRFLLNIMNDILDLSKIESGKLTVELMRCSPRQLILDVANLMRVRAEAKGLELIVLFTTELPATILTDPTRLQQILINLLGNAIKFTERGEISVIAACRRQPVATALGSLSAGKEQPQQMEDIIELQVKDTGIGIEPRRIDQLFQPFTQADASITRKFGGTGLGLTICKRLLEMLGGTITIDSTPGKGTVFTIRLPLIIFPGEETVLSDSGSTWRSVPLEEPELQPPPPPTPNKTEEIKSGPTALFVGGRILVAEDGIDNQRLLLYLLQKQGLDIEVVENGQEAVQTALVAEAAGKRFDLILMDMQMPVLDGRSATMQLRQRGYTGPIVALTAHAMAGEREQCLKLGFDGYASKPIKKRDLLQMIARFVPTREEKQASANP